jgi:hypothetical protein
MPLARKGNGFIGYGLCDYFWKTLKKSEKIWKTTRP